MIPRANDYTRMFSAPARRAAPAPDSPRRDKKPRPDTGTPSPPCSPPHDVELRQRAPDSDQPVDRLSASDYYTVSEDITPQPFKGNLMWRKYFFGVCRCYERCRKSVQFDY